MKTTLALTWWLTKIVLWVTVAWCVLAVGTWAVILLALVLLGWATVHYSIRYHRTWKARQ